MRDAAAGRGLALLRLVRISLAPSAAADALVGLVLGARGAWPGGARPLALVVASLGIYHGAMALNDWADRAQDACERPDRPVPSGAVSPRAALAVALGLMAGGVAAAAWCAPLAGAWMGGVAALAAAYDLFGRGPLLGPALLGLCRAGNLGAGVVLVHAWSGAEALDPTRLALPALYGLYVFAVSSLARLEDGEDERPLGRRPAAFVLAAAVLLLAVPGVGALLAHASGIGLALAAAIALPAAVAPVRTALRTHAWSRPLVGRTTGALLRRSLTFTAACAALHVGHGTAAPLVAALALAGLPLSFALRRRFPPT